MQMQLTSPMFISARLMAAVKIAEGTEQEAIIHIAPNGSDMDGKPAWHYIIDGPNEMMHEATDLYGYGDVRRMMASLLSFLSASAEGYQFSARTDSYSENSDLFPDAVVEWAYMVSDELTMLEFDLDAS